MKIGINFRAVCLCLSCDGCIIGGTTVIMCKRDCTYYARCTPLGGCPGYKKEARPMTKEELAILQQGDRPFLKFTEGDSYFK